MAEAERKQFRVEDLDPVFRTLGSLGWPCVLMGGQAASFWSRRFLHQQPLLRACAELSPFLSKDVDFQGSLSAAKAMAAAFHAPLQTPDFRNAFGNLLAGKFVIEAGDLKLPVEILRKIPGLTDSELSQWSEMHGLSGIPIRVLNPAGMLFAKAWNAGSIAQEGRHDVEQLFALVLCAREFFHGFLSASASDPLALRAGLKLIERFLRFAERPAGRKAAAACGVNWAWVLPHATLAADTRPAVVRLRTRRLPRWLASVARQRRGVPANLAALKMLTLLTEHAEPPCVPAPAIARAAKYVPRPARRA